MSELLSSITVSLIVIPTVELYGGLYVDLHVLPRWWSRPLPGSALIA